MYKLHKIDAKYSIGKKKVVHNREADIPDTRNFDEKRLILFHSLHYPNTSRNHYIRRSDIHINVRDMHLVCGCVRRGAPKKFREKSRRYKNFRRS